jgi:hypothetical protein
MKRRVKPLKWHIVEWMLEPFNWFDFIAEHFGKFVIGAVVQRLF